MAVVFTIRRSAWARVRVRFWVALVVTLGAFVAVEAGLIEMQTWRIALACAALWVGVLAKAWGYPRLLRFWIAIEPNWAAIGRDYVIDPEDVRGFGDEAQEERYAGVRRIAFTVLEPSLAFRHGRETFFSETDIVELLPGWEARHRRRWDRIPKGEPHDPPSDYVESVYVYIYSRATTRRDDHGYELGITTEKSREKSDHPSDEKGRIPLSTLPFVALARYWDVEDDRYSDDRRREIKASLQRNGWTEEERDPGDHIPWPTCLKHKYFTVYHRSI